MAWGERAHNGFLGKSVSLLVGSLLIGAVMGESGRAPIAPVSPASVSIEPAVLLYLDTARWL